MNSLIWLINKIQTLDIASSGIALRSLFSNACLLKMYDGFRKESLHEKIDDARIFSNRTTKWLFFLWCRCTVKEQDYTAITHWPQASVGHDIVVINQKKGPKLLPKIYISMNLLYLLLGKRYVNQQVLNFRPSWRFVLAVSIFVQGMSILSFMFWHACWRLPHKKEKGNIIIDTIYLFFLHLSLLFV